MKIRQFNQALHRDLGYFFFAVTLIYALSGIALNHRNDWNPNFIITSGHFSLEKELVEKGLDPRTAQSILDALKLDAVYRTHLVSGRRWKIFVKDGSLVIDPEKGEGSYEILRKRPLFHQINFLHYNKPGKLWTWFADLYALALILLAVTGLFILKGKKGITGRGAWLTILGILVPLVFLFLYL